jgi:hypothetical protein
MPTPLDTPQKHVKTMTEAVQASNRSSVIVNRGVSRQLDSGNMSSWGFDTLLYGKITLTTNLPSQSPTALPMMVLPTLEPPMMALPTLLPWSKHLPSYPPRMICGFCFEDSHKSKKTTIAGIVGKNLTAAKQLLKVVNLKLRT